jgi:hypothetical protein
VALRAAPGDRATVLELVPILERRGRDLDLFALVSATIEEADDALKDELAPIRREVLGRLADRARREGRAGEAELYESMMRSS